MGCNDNRPLMVPAETPTRLENLNTFYDHLLRAAQSLRERELENQLKVLEENIKVHFEFLSQIHNAAAQTLLGHLQGPAETIAINTQSLSTHGFNFPPQSRAGAFTGREMVSIGPNRTRVSAELYYSINWSSPLLATRKLLSAIFQRYGRATHSPTGQQSSGFTKHKLNSLIVADIVFAVTQKCNVSANQVRTFINIKCVDEDKLFKLQMNKRKSRE